jgi:chemotaxis protein CheY-P-specific phosphatase CheC
MPDNSAATPFTEPETNLLADVSQIALRNAVNSFSQMLKDEFVLKRFEAYPSAPETQAHEGVYLLKTDITGDIGVNTIIAVSADAHDKICKVMLPGSVAGQAEMREAILLELDNIIVASLVTKYSNLLGVNIYGSVPQLAKAEQGELEKLLKEQQIDKTIYSYKVVLSAFKSQFDIEMICLFDDNLLPFVQEFSFDKTFVGQKKKEGKSSFFNKLF